MTAYDLVDRVFPTHPSADAWNSHVASELLAPWWGRRQFLCGFSGGALLALSGRHSRRECFGAAALGADGLSTSFKRPPHWRAPLQLYTVPVDPVSGSLANQKVARSLAERGEAVRRALPRGEHRLIDYLPAVTELLAFAHRLAMETKEPD